MIGNVISAKRVLGRVPKGSVLDRSDVARPESDGLATLSRFSYY